MSDLYCVIDVSYLAYRAYHSMPRGLEYGDIPTTVAYGIFQTLEGLQRDWSLSTERMIFAFDQGPFHRESIYPAYKGKRNGTDEERKAREAVKREVKRLQVAILPAMGFVNCFSFQGYEADDVIAVACQKLEWSRVMMVSGDKDLYQLLKTDRHFVWTPVKQETFTEKKLKAATGLTPKQWVKVKALAGCSSDNIPGVRSIGEKSAIEFLLTGTLTAARLAAFKKARADGSLKLWKSLVTLPFDDGIDFEIKRNKVTNDKIKQAFKKLGIQTIRIEA